MANQSEMTLIEFREKFHSEEVCREHLYAMRWTEGFVCPKCGEKDEPFQVASRHLYQCKHCGYQASVTVGTVMEKTRIPLLKWFWAMFLMGHDKRGCSALQISRELSLSYSAAWYLCQRIRSAMGERDTQYLLSGYIEADDAFFGAPTSNGKRGRGTGKTVVMVGMSLNEKGQPRYAKMQVVPNVKGETVASFALDNVEQGATINSDGYSPYNILSQNGFIHQGVICDLVNNPDHLKWLHVIISNAKAFITGTYHGLGKLHFQLYLDEFCFRFNRNPYTRRDIMFRLQSAICGSKPSEKISYY